MKKVISFALVLVLIMSLSVVAFAAGSTKPAPSNAGYTTRTVAAAGNGVGLYDKNGKLVATVPAADVLNVPVGQANKLSDADKEAFLAAYEDAKAVENKVVKYFFWFDVPEQYKTADVAYALYNFTCTGENVEVTVNGNPMEVESLGGISYAAKLTEFGAVAILCD